MSASTTPLGMRRLALGGALLLAFAGTAMGESQRPLTLAEARRLAVLRNADYRVAQTQVEAALAQLRVAREFPNPVLGLLAAKVSTDGVPEATALGNGLLDRSYDSIVSLSQLFTVGKRGLQREAAAAAVHTARFQREDAKRLLLQAVTQAYAAALAARAQADVLKDSAGKLRHEADIARHRLKAGDLSASDEAQLELAADQDELGAESQEVAARTAVVTLEILLGEPSPRGISALADSLDSLVGSIEPSLEESPVGLRPDIAAAQAAVQQAEANERLQRRSGLPDVTASLQFERNPPAQPDTVGFGLSLPLPVWDRFGGEIEAARAARESTEAQLDGVRIKAAADVSAARLAFHEAYARERRYESSLIPKSARVSQSLSYAFNQGGASLVELLEAERNDNAIRLAAAQAQADAASAAVALEASLARIDDGAH